MFHKLMAKPGVSLSAQLLTPQMERGGNAVRIGCSPTRGTGSKESCLGFVFPKPGPSILSRTVVPPPCVHALSGWPFCPSACHAPPRRPLPLFPTEALARAKPTTAWLTFRPF